MEYTDELTLIKLTTEQDNIGNVTVKEARKEILARPNVVGTKEFYSAVAVGIKPAAELQIRALNYSGEEEVEYKGIRYSVIRTIPKGKFDLVLVIGQKQGING